jgi:hypothetical protein
VATVPTGGATARNELFPAKCHTSVAAVAGFDANSGFIEEHYFLSSVAEAG